MNHSPFCSPKTVHENMPFLSIPSNKATFHNLTENFGADWKKDGDDIIMMPVYDVNDTVIVNGTTLEDGFLSVISEDLPGRTSAVKLIYHIVSKNSLVN